MNIYGKPVYCWLLLHMRLVKLFVVSIIFITFTITIATNTLFIVLFLDRIVHFVKHAGGKCDWHLHSCATECTGKFLRKVHKVSSYMKTTSFVNYRKSWNGAQFTLLYERCVYNNKPNHGLHWSNRQLRCTVWNRLILLQKRAIYWSNMVIVILSCNKRTDTWRV